jgi:uncharacterized phage infection (PIP) family protein YhgE
MSAFRALVGEREARAALAIWAIVPALFLFFALALAVDPSAHLDRLRIGVANLDAGLTTPQGQVSVGAQLSAGLGTQTHAEILPFASEAELRDAVTARDIVAGIVFPPGMTQSLKAGQAVQPAVVRMDANDAFTNSFTANLATVLASAVGSAATAMQGGTPPASLGTVIPQNLAAARDFRLASAPASLVLPLWVATLAFSLLATRAGDHRRQASGVARTGIAELALAGVGGAVTAAILALLVGLCTGLWELDLIGLFGILWLGLVAMSWLVLGTIRAFGLGIGAALAILALFVQQPVSGATFPSAFASDWVRWAEPIAPLRYLLEGIRNALVGGSTMSEVAIALAILAIAGVALALTGAARLGYAAGHSTVPSARRSNEPA